MENLVTWLMTFGAKAEVLEPKEARDIIRRNAEETLKSYGGLRKMTFDYKKEYKEFYMAEGNTVYCQSPENELYSGEGKR